MTVGPSQTLYVRDLPSDAPSVYADNIVSVWRMATAQERAAGAVWYREARSHAACIGDLLGLTGQEAIDAGAGVMAVLSPQLEWSRNIAEAYRLTVAWVDNDTAVLNELMAFPRNVDKASRILAGESAAEVVSGPKVTAFYRAIAGHPGGPVIDRHATRVATANEYSAVTTSTYYTVQSAYVSAARMLRVNEHTLQATVWLTCKRERSDDSV
jgi:hypothetical protein